MKKTMLVLIMLAFSLFCGTAKALPTYGFTHITESGDGPAQLADGAIGEAQMFVELIGLPDTGTGIQVQFLFTNTGPQASSITDVYFDGDGTLLNIASIDNTSIGVSFSQLASPPSLPGGNNVSPSFLTTPGFSADSDSPTQPNGVNPGEYLGITFDLKTGGDFDDILGEIDSGELRIGIHVQGYASGGSESFINNGRTCEVPAPGALLLGCIGSGVVTFLRRRRTL
jgi:hypothetical protein